MTNDKLTPPGLAHPWEILDPPLVFFFVVVTVGVSPYHDRMNMHEHP